MNICGNEDGCFWTLVISFPKFVEVSFVVIEQRIRLWFLKLLNLTKRRSNSRRRVSGEGTGWSPLTSPCFFLRSSFSKDVLTFGKRVNFLLSVIFGSLFLFLAKKLDCRVEFEIGRICPCSTTYSDNRYSWRNNKYNKWDLFLVPRFPLSSFPNNGGDHWFVVCLSFDGSGIRM